MDLLWGENEAVLLKVFNCCFPFGRTEIQGTKDNMLLFIALSSDRYKCFHVHVSRQKGQLALKHTTISLLMPMLLYFS